jgi:uncharacterized phage-like protein YoqJ
MSNLWTDSARNIVYEWCQRPTRIVLAGTGHRPPRLGLKYDIESNRKLTHFVRDYLTEIERPELVVSGMAQGFDQALAHAAVLEGLPLLAAIPFDGHSSIWPDSAKRRYEAILSRATQVVVVCPGGAAPAKFIARDIFMVDLASRVVALYDGNRKGGTAKTVKYSQTSDKPIDNLWNRWISSE